MLRRRFVLPAAIVSLLLVTAWPSLGSASEDKLPSKSDASCLKCHEYDKMPGILAGRVHDVAIKSKTIQLQVGKEMEVIHFDDSTELKNAPTFKEIPKQEAIKVTYVKKDGKTFAKQVEVKKGIEVPKEQLATVEEVAELVAKGPEKGKYVLLDSRPDSMYNEGHIPTALSMPFFAFDKLADKLLKDKDTLQIYYCAGLSCVLSPLAARKAEKLGYKNVKVFHAGLPAWKKAGNVVVSNIAAIENYDKNDASYILIDLRPKKLIEQGHLPKAVEVAESGIDSMKEQFPKFKAAAIILYDQDGDTGLAKEAYKKISDWGYKQVSVLAGGYQGWEKAGKQVAKGPVETKINYVRKLMPGEVELAVFKEAVENPSKGWVVLDVRGKSEAAAGALPNTLNIPLDELEQRLADIPKDKQIVIHCGTGARAEMAYNVLKKAGIDAKYVKAKVEADKDKYTIEE
jgi:rhodanese-related sulfurtransferase